MYLCMHTACACVCVYMSNIVNTCHYMPTPFSNRQLRLCFSVQAPEPFFRQFLGTWWRTVADRHTIARLPGKQVSGISGICGEFRPKRWCDCYGVIAAMRLGQQPGKNQWVSHIKMHTCRHMAYCQFWSGDISIFTNVLRFCMPKKKNLAISNLRADIWHSTFWMVLWSTSCHHLQELRFPPEQ